MKRFADLYEAIDRTTSTNGKVAALVDYLRDAPPADAAWALCIRCLQFWSARCTWASV